jgi:hypothetical protein
MFFEADKDLPAKSIQLSRNDNRHSAFGSLPLRPPGEIQKPDLQSITILQRDFFWFPEFHAAGAAGIDGRRNID